jgi:hypothetical protein
MSGVEERRRITEEGRRKYEIKGGEKRREW